MTKNWQSSDRANIASDIDVVSTNFKTIFRILTKRSGSPSDTQTAQCTKRRLFC